jgi:hypothetical protein
MTPQHFYIFIIISPFKKTWPFIWTNLNFLYPRIICTKFDWIWPADSGEDFWNFSVHFYSFLLSPVEKDNPLHLNKLESSPLRMICAKSVWNWSCGSGEEVENVKVYRQTDRRRTTGDQNSSLELSAQVTERKSSDIYPRVLGGMDHEYSQPPF